MWKKGCFTALMVCYLVSLVSSEAWADYTANILYPLTVPTNFNSLYIPVSSPRRAAGGQFVAADTATDPLTGFTENYALMWDSTGHVIDLNPPGYISSSISATNGVQQLGGGLDRDGNGHVLLWSGSPNAFVDLTPTSSSYTSATGNGMSLTQQVGFASAKDGEHAVLWNGSATSMVDLNPAGFESQAFGTDGIHQVGVGFNYGATHSTYWHAMLWSGGASSYVDLQPSNFDTTDAFGVSGDQQVGSGVGAQTFSLSHALLWHGSADSVIDLNPPGYSSSIAYGTDGIHQVGWGESLSGLSHAMIWSGSATSAIDLGAALPPEYRGSNADSIDAQGDVFGYALDDASETYVAVEWTPTPEPGTLVGFTVVASASLLRRRVRRV